MLNGDQVVARGGEVRAWLAAARLRAESVEAVREAWRMVRIEVVCPGAAGLGDNPNTPARVRGAWLSALREAASEAAARGGPCLWSPPCGFDLFHNSHGTLIGGLEVPKPFVLATEADGADLTIALTLFGVAGDWAGEAAEALVRGLRGGLDGEHDRRPLAVAARRISEAPWVPAIDLSRGAVLRFLSPVAVREGDSAHARPASLLKSLGNRVAGLALWQGVALDLDRGLLDQQAEDLAKRAEWRVGGVPAWRRGLRTQGRTARMSGALGELWLPPCPPLIADQIALGQSVHIGGRTTLGVGRYEIVAVRL